MLAPYIINFKTLGEEGSGFLSFLHHKEEVPFDIKRVYWIYGVEDNQIRGNHAHKKGEQVLIAMSGQITVELELPEGAPVIFLLNHPSKGLFVPGVYWRKVQLSKDAVLVSLASTEYDEDNYIREYHKFKKQ